MEMWKREDLCKTKRGSELSKDLRNTQHLDLDFLIPLPSKRNESSTEKWSILRLVLER